MAFFVSWAPPMGSPNTRGQFAVEAAAVCSGCRARVPLTRLAKEVACPSCAARTAIDWQSLIVVRLREHTMSVLDLLPGCSDGDVLIGADPEVRIVVERARCACGAAFDDALLAKISFKTTSVACPTCERHTPARLVKDDIIPNVRWVLGERDGTGASSEGIVTRCGACGAPTKGSGGAEVCAFCGVTTTPTRGAPRSAAPRIHLVVRSS
jgi:LSD1 subclass zinc finger protein